MDLPPRTNQPLNKARLAIENNCVYVCTYVCACIRFSVGFLFCIESCFFCESHFLWSFLLILMYVHTYVIIYCTLHTYVSI